MIRIIRFKNDFNDLSLLQKTKYIQELLKKENLKQVINSLIYYNDDVLECFEIVNVLTKKKNFNKKYKISNIELVSMMIKSLINQNKTNGLESYLNEIDPKKLEKIINYEIKNNTTFSHMKICKKIYNDLNKVDNNLEKTKKIINIEDRILDIKENKKEEKKLNIEKTKKDRSKRKIDKKSKLSKKKDKTKILKKEIKSKKAKLSIGIIIFLFILVISYILLGYLYSIVFFYNGHIYPNIYLNGKLIEGEKHEGVINYLEEYDKKLDNFIKLSNVNDEFLYSFKEIGIEVNTKEIEKELIDAYKDLNGFTKIKKIFIGEELKYDVLYSINPKKYEKFLEELSSKVNLPKKEEEFRIINGEIYYVKGINGFSLNTDNFDTLLLDAINNDKEEIVLNGIKEEVSNPLSVINKKVATYTTYYNESQSRAKNIRNAVNKLNGKIIYPDEVFSYYKTVGPYNGKGYVYYDGVIGNGVCQVSSTIYNVQLLLNLPIISRYNHGEMVPYVEYGMDATVYKNTVDYKFKNNTKYPIYIEATANNGALTISFWSNENIIEPGYSYKPRSVKVSYLGYKTYIDIYYNGQLKETKYLNSSYYFKGK